MKPYSEYAWVIGPVNQTTNMNESNDNTNDEEKRNQVNTIPNEQLYPKVLNKVLEVKGKLIQKP